MLSFALLLVGTFLGAVASLFLKRASEHANFIMLFKNFNIYVGGALYLIAAILNILVLRTLDYSVVLPLTSITYIWTMVISYFILGEQMTKKKIYGVIFIVLGAICISM